MEYFRSLKCAVLNISKGGRKGREPLKKWYPRWFCRMEAAWKSDYCLGLGLGEFRGWWCCVSGKQGLHLPLSCPVTDNSKLLMCRTGTGMLSFLCWTFSKNKMSGFSQHYTGECFLNISYFSFPEFFYMRKFPCFLSKHRYSEVVSRVLRWVDLTFQRLLLSAWNAWGPEAPTFLQTELQRWFPHRMKISQRDCLRPRQKQNPDLQDPKPGVLGLKFETRRNICNTPNLYK